MLRFNQVGYHGLEQILINFNTSYVTVQPPRLAASAGAFLLFQYILCYGSTYLGNGYREYYFGFQYILCYGSTGTRFIRTRRYTEFQYILCYGSTQQSMQHSAPQPNFNTSYVTVQHTLCTLQKQVLSNFNTSYVTVQHGIRLSRSLGCRISIHPMLRFNLDNVKKHLEVA